MEHDECCKRRSGERASRGDRNKHRLEMIGPEGVRSLLGVLTFFAGVIIYKPKLNYEAI